MKSLLPRDDNGFNDDNVSEHCRYVGIASEIQVGNSKFFSIVDESEKSVDIAVVNIDGHYYALSNTYTHKGTTPSIGFMEGKIVVCSWH
jgi:nitrite reductase/ring-hydroxylating ferredoxin subunit